MITYAEYLKRIHDMVGNHSDFICHCIEGYYGEGMDEYDGRLREEIAAACAGATTLRRFLLQRYEVPEGAYEQSVSIDYPVILRKRWLRELIEAERAANRTGRAK